MAYRDKPLVITTRKLPAPIEKRMGELFDVRLLDTDRAMTRQELIEAVQSADVLVPTISDQIDYEILRHASPKLKLIANFGNGIDNIDINAAAHLGILVTNTPNVLTQDTADMTMALILAVPRRLVEGANIFNKTGDWPGWAPNWMLGHRISGKKLGIIGMGRIGTAVARRARQFGLSIHYHNRHRASSFIEEQIEGHYWRNLDEMLAEMDIISLNCPSTPETYHLISRQRLQRMRPSAYIVNTARGEIIDENALVEAIERQQLAGAGLDLFGKDLETRARLATLARAGKVILLPHIASATIEGRIEMGEKVIINIRAFFDHHRPPDRIIPESRSSFTC